MCYLCEKQMYCMEGRSNWLISSLSDFFLLRKLRLCHVQSRSHWKGGEGRVPSGLRAQTTAVATCTFCYRPDDVLEWYTSLSSYIKVLFPNCLFLFCYSHRWSPLLTSLSVSSFFKRRRLLVGWFVPSPFHFQGSLKVSWDTWFCVHKVSKRPRWYNK